MKDRPIIRRPLADQDVQDAVALYSGEGGVGVAAAFIAEVRKAFGHIGRYPASGSERYGHDLALPGLRCWPVSRFPYLVFYTEGPEFVDVWRVLHGRRDLANVLTPASGTSASGASPTPGDHPPGSGGPPPG